MKKDLKINIDYYEKNWKSLIDQYEKANPTYLHSLLLEYTNKEDLILELGFGSGRELNFLYKKGYKNLFGIDAS
ncbi:MAG: hypothetical protein GXO02_05085, partial [Epsilonproteobacteria bacterium]|nr:hypothetical protein [Campylobacterota bacterium]